MLLMGYWKTDWEWRRSKILGRLNRIYLEMPQEVAEQLMQNKIYYFSSAEK